MAQITLRLSDDLLEAIDNDCGPETSRSEWFREAARLRLQEDRELNQRLDRIEDRLDELEQRDDRPLLERVLGP